MQEMTTISESGLYSLVLTSRKPEAKRFKKWVTSEVIPSIRKTGAYNLKPMTQIQIILAQAQALEKLEQQQIELNARTERNERRLDQIETASDHFTVLGYHLYLHKERLTLPDAAKIGAVASKYCKQHEVPMGEVPDPRFGKVKTYPKWVLDEITKTIQ
jgi:hypothetical protein